MKKLALLLLCTAICTSVQAAPFQNLGFDQGTIDDSSSGTTQIGSSATLLPGWQLYYGHSVQSVMAYDTPQPVGVGQTAILFDDQTIYFPRGFVEGRFALFVVADSFDGQTVSISQRGDIPVDATYFGFRYQGNPFSVAINGADIPVAYANGAQLFFDVSRFEAQTVDLRLTTTFAEPFPSPIDAHFLDSLHFIPEPSITFLLLMGAGGLLCILGSRSHEGSTPLYTFRRLDSWFSKWPNRTAAARSVCRRALIFAHQVVCRRFPVSVSCRLAHRWRKTD